MRNGYLQQKAAPWVSMSVLAGGLLAACILLFVYRIESQISNINAISEEDLATHLEERGY